ncbi:MAG: hypothetical protein KatS3mg023_0451 [Armatimonadota bacterium]|nr:MAG: hypothetical protein KatS3mg023_0451 [Armatimonadota bacterium]
MKGLRLWFTAGIASATLMLLSLSPASALQFWITKAGDTTPITELMVAPGEEFTISVWVQHENRVNSILVMLGYDRTTGLGERALPTDNKIAGVGVETNPPPGFTAAVQKGGARGSGTRPYGYSILVANVQGDASISAGHKLADVTLRNDGLMPGGTPYPIVIWDAGTGGIWTTVAMEPPSTPVRPLGGGVGSAYTLNLVPVPEPGSLMALATGVVGLAGMALRRRRA